MPTNLELFTAINHIASAGLERLSVKELSKYSSAFSRNEIVQIFDPDPFKLIQLFLYLIDDDKCPLLLSDVRDMDSQFGGILKGQINRPAKATRLATPNTYGCLSSGSTGSKKHIFFDVKKGLLNANAHGNSIGLENKRIINQFLPVSHSFGVVSYIFASLVFKKPINFTTFFNLTDNFKSDSINYFTPLFFNYTDEDYIKSFKNCILSFGAAPTNIERLMKIQSFEYSNDVYTTYGFSEAGPRVTTGKIKNFTLDVSKCPSPFWIGRPIEKVSIQINENSVQIKTPYASSNSNNSIISCSDILTEVNDDYFFIARADNKIKLNGFEFDLLEIKKKISQTTGAEPESFELKPSISGFGQDFVAIVVKNESGKFKNFNIEVENLPFKILEIKEYLTQNKLK